MIDIFDYAIPLVRLIQLVRPRGRYIPDRRATGLVAADRRSGLML